MPRATLKATKASDSASKWADLLQAELNREHQWPEGAKSFDEITQMRKAAGLASGGTSVSRFLMAEVAAGRVRKIRGTKRLNGKLVVDWRYVVAS